MNEFVNKPDTFQSSEGKNEYANMSEVALLAERERLLLLKRMADEATDFEQWPRAKQDEAINASARIYELQEILNQKLKDEKETNKGT